MANNNNGKHHLRKVRIDDLLTHEPITINQKKVYEAYKRVIIYFSME